MFKKSLISLLLATLLLMSSLPLAAQGKPGEALPDNVPALLGKANSAFAAEDYSTYSKVLERLRVMRPNNSEYMYQSVIAYALLDEKRKAYDLMLRMQQQGLAYDFTQSEATMNIRDTEVFDYVNDLMILAAQPMGESEVVFTLPDSVVMPETIAWDESRQKFLVGTVVDGSIYAVGKDGETSELLQANDENGLWAIYDILVDTGRNRLWVTSAATRAFSGFDPVDQGRSALFEFDLKTLEMLRRYPVPVDGRPHVLGSMTMGPDGDIFIADRALPVVYSKPADEKKLKAVLASRDMISMRGIALKPDGSMMYIADREMGIMVVDMQGERAGKLAVPATFNTGGIDGLYLWDNYLVIIQNGIKPQRVMRLELDATGTQVASVRPLAVAQPEFDYPSFGTTDGNKLYYFANSQSLNDSEPPKAITVLSTAMDASADLAQPDMQQFLEMQAEKVQERARRADKSQEDASN